MQTRTVEERLERVRAELAEPWTEGEERLFDVGSVPVAVRKRARRYYVDDRGEAVARAREVVPRRDWLEVAERVVEEYWLNVNRRGVVFVTVVEGRDVAELVVRVGDCAEAVYAALLEDESAIR